MNVMLIGVNDELRNSLEPVLQSLDSVPGRENAFDVIFCGAEAGLIDRVRRSNPEARIVAVTRLAETDRWLDAIEAGADDYCAAPFEAFHLRWTLDGFAQTVQH